MLKSRKLVIKRTELFNYKQTLDTSKEKAKIKETSAEISRLDGEIKALQKAKEEKNQGTQTGCHERYGLQSGV